MKNKLFDQDVIDRLLVAKDLLEKIRFLPIANPDRFTISKHILTAHDAAELAIAGIARHLKVLPKSLKTYLMDYFQPISETHPGEDVAGRDYFSQLNEVRIGIKHKGIFPETKQWFRVGEKTYSYVAIWCQRYLHISLDDLDESDMITDPDVKKQYDLAKISLDQGDYKGVLENLALALYSLFESNQALRNLRVGKVRAEDALKLSAFGVHANEFLALQEFLPCVRYSNIDNQVTIDWEQEIFGHPANWNHDTAEFCLKTFVSIALRIQDAEWIPMALDFNLVYEHKITALVDDVNIVQERLIKGMAKALIGPTEKVVVHTLKKGESMRGEVTKKDDLASLFGREHKPILHFMNYKESIWGDIEADKVSITCVPRDAKIVREYFPNLPEFEYK
jgi:hypothetical protein